MMGCPRSRKLELIADEKSRKVTFRKRSLGLARKARELATLCGTDVLVAIVHDGDGATASTTQIIFPDADVARILGRYRSVMKLVKKHPGPRAANHTAALPIKKTDDDEAAVGRSLREDLRAKIEEVTSRINTLTLALLPNPQPPQDYGWSSLSMGTGASTSSDGVHQNRVAPGAAEDEVLKMKL